MWHVYRDSHRRTVESRESCYSTLHDAQLRLVARRAMRRDTLPVPFDQGGKRLEGPEPLPLELLRQRVKNWRAQHSRR